MFGKNNINELHATEIGFLLQSLSWVWKYDTVLVEKKYKIRVHIKYSFIQEKNPKALVTGIGFEQHCLCLRAAALRAQCVSAIRPGCLCVQRAAPSRARACTSVTGDTLKCWFLFCLHQCEECEKPFLRLQRSDSELIAKCVFCRRSALGRKNLPLPPSVSLDL